MTAIRCSYAILASAVGIAAALGTEASARPARAPVQPVISFSETYAETPNADGGHLVVDAKIPLDPADVATFDASTWFDIDVGYFSLDVQLADDPRWRPGMTTATFTDVGWDGATQLVAKIRWTPRQLIVHIDAITGDDVEPVVCDTYVEDDTSALADATEADIQFGDADIWWDTIPCAGRVVTRTSAYGDVYSNVRMHGRSAR
jgi:hypothetical protein